MAVRCELVLTSARLRRADKLTPKLKEINIKKLFERRAERAFAAEPLGEPPFTTLGGIIQILVFFSVDFPFQSLVVAAFPFSSALAKIPLILS